MKRIFFLLFFIPTLLSAREMNSIINDLVDNLAADYTEMIDEPLYSKQTVSIIGIRNTTKEMEGDYIGQGVEELLKNALADSLVFKLVDRKNLEAAMDEIKLSLSGITDSKDAPELGKIRGVKLLLDGSVIEQGSDFVINLRLTDVETTEVVAAASIHVPKDLLIEESSRIAYEYVTANGIGLSMFVSPSRYLILNQEKTVAVGDGNYYSFSAGSRLTYRINRKWKLSLDTDIKGNDVYFDKRKIGDMKNLTAWDDIFDDSNVEIFGFWEKDGSFENYGDKSSVEAKLVTDQNYYTLSQTATTASFIVSRVFSLSQKFNISAGIGPHFNYLRYTETYDNVPILINQGVGFKRYEIVMDFLGLGGTANINIEYFVLPRFAVNFGISGFYSYIFSKSNGKTNAWSPTTGEYYYGIDDYSIESFGLNPFMMPDGTMITSELYSANCIKGYLGASIYF